MPGEWDSSQRGGGLVGEQQGASAGLVQLDSMGAVGCFVFPNEQQPTPSMVVQELGPLGGTGHEPVPWAAAVPRLEILPGNKTH